MSTHTQHDLGYFSRRSSTLFLVVSLHAALAYALLTAITHAPVVNRTPIQNLPLPIPQPRALPPALTKPQLKVVTIEVTRPEVEVPANPDPTTNVTSEVVQEPSGAVSPVPPPRMVKKVQGGPGAGFPDPDDFYPDLARRMDEQGIATVQVCVDARGRLTSDPTTLQGTGSPRLDESALKLARAGSGHYRATTEDGQPVNSCYSFRIRFQLKN